MPSIASLGVYTGVYAQYSLPGCTMVGYMPPYYSWVYHGGLYASLLYPPGYTLYILRLQCTPGYTVTRSPGVGREDPGL